jgi:hypothetical protein
MPHNPSFSRVIVTFTGVLVAALLPAVSQAGVRTIAPPGNSGVSQYTEVIPTAKGNRPTSSIPPGAAGIGGASASGAAPGSSLSAAAVRGLAKRGKDGKRAAALALAGGPGPATASGSGSRSRGSSALATLFKTVTGASASSGLRATLPAILLIVAAGGSLIALRRRRTH